MADPADPKHDERDDDLDDDLDDDDDVSTPFDHPLFLPILLVGLSLWFGYDGFINQDPEMLEHVTFNRVGFAILAPAALWFGYKGGKEWREMQAAKREPRDPVA